MAKTPYQIQDVVLGQSLRGSFVNFTYRTATAATGSPAVGTFHSTVVNRAPMVDLSNDLMPRIGIERMTITDLARVEEECGPNGETVWRPASDVFNQVRFIGHTWANQYSVNGAMSFAGSASSDYIEVTFYGTGLNVLCEDFDGNRNMYASVDGGSLTSDLMPPSGALIHTGRPWRSPINAASNLALGIHTVRLVTDNGWLRVCGFEFLNESSQLKVTPGSVLLNGTKINVAAHSSAYNSGFESGTLGTKGGRVLVYLKSDGTVAKAVNPTDASQVFYPTAITHSNEENVRSYVWREFGASRTDDVASVNNNVAGGKHYTIDDGTTNITGMDMQADFSPGSNPLDGLKVGDTDGASEGPVFTFVGTGVDVIIYVTSNSSSWTYNLNNTGSAVITEPTANIQKTVRIASGLPYGTHTLRISRNVGDAVRVLKYIVYAPKKPTLPDGAIALGEYSILANYSPTIGGGVYSIASGTIRKTAHKELVLNGTWLAQNDVTVSPAGALVSNTQAGAYMEYTFWGTGFEWRGETNTTYSGNLTVSLQNITAGGSLLTLNSTNFPGLTTGLIATGASFNYATGALSTAVSNASSNGFYVNGLPLSLYKLRITNNVSTTFRHHVLDIITPLHVHAFAGPVSRQHAASFGRPTVKDLRPLSSAYTKYNTATNQGFLSQSNLQDGLVRPVNGAFATIYTTTGRLQVSGGYVASVSGGTAQIHTDLYVDGERFIKPNTSADQYLKQGIDGVSFNGDVSVSMNKTILVTPGWHLIGLYHRANVGGATGVDIVEGRAWIDIAELP